MSALSTDTVLAQEALAIDPGITDSVLVGLAASDSALTTGTRDQKLGVGGDDAVTCAETAQRQQSLYQALNRLDRAVLCLSGGGIRSAAFSLGVIQALATHPRPRPLSDEDAARKGPQDAEKDADNVVEHPQDSLLAQLHYLSTVSGGGYIGSWLSAWRLRAGFPIVWENLVRRPCGPDVEPGTIAWLRSYSNYLSPKLGALSADTWSGIAIYLRNLMLNWLVIVPVICITVLLLKIIAVASIGIAHYPPNRTLVAVFTVIAIAALLLALGVATHYRPTRRADDPRERPGPQGIRQGTFIRWDLVPATLAAGAFIELVASNSGLALLGPHGKWLVIGGSAVAGAVLYAASYLLALPRRPGRHDFGLWTVSGLIYGALLGSGAYVYNQAPFDGLWLFNDLLLPVMFGVPWILLSQLIAEMIFVGLSSFEKESDNDREWLGRAAGWYLVTSLGWLVVTFLTFAGSLLVDDLTHHLETWIAPLGGVAGIVTALVGKSPLSPGRGQEAKGAKPLPTNIILAIAVPLFAAALIIFLSAVLDKLLFGESVVVILRFPGTQLFAPDWWELIGWLLVGLVIAVAIAWVASRSININRFSMHAVYRNRLVRAFLGASRLQRSPDAFSGFDPADNPYMDELWPRPDDERPERRSAEWRPFHVINIALNIVSTKRLSWQERKAEPFTVSALHSGSGCLGFRHSSHYGDRISLGTAMAISGAAASPNMGYHSSPGVTFLLTLLNVRLGWWLGNPGPYGEKTYAHHGPKRAIQPLIEETFGLTTDERPYVYLSDGGHFENLGIYEMVRRRCRYIIAVDTSADSDYAFEDLGNAVRKIALDLGVNIRFYGLTKLLKRAVDAKEKDIGDPHPYHAIGDIDYPSADGDGGRGVILYIKPGYHGVEDAGIRSYAVANPTFPHQGTIDQFFSESQFESYRALGFEITDRLLSNALANIPPGNRSLPQILEELKKMVGSAP